jgi:hypothetical protein
VGRWRRPGARGVGAVRVQATVGAARSQGALAARSQAAFGGAPPERAVGTPADSIAGAGASGYRLAPRVRAAGAAVTITPSAG